MLALPSSPQLMLSLPSGLIAEGSGAALVGAKLLHPQALVSPRAASIWTDPLLATILATTAVSLLLISAWLLRRRSRQGRGAASVCLLVSVILHLALIFLLPQLEMFGGGSGRRELAPDATGSAPLVFATFDPALPTAASGSVDGLAEMQPLPLPNLIPEAPAAALLAQQEPEAAVEHQVIETTELPQSLAAPQESEDPPPLDELLADWLSEQPDTAVPSTAAPPQQAPPAGSAASAEADPAQQAAGGESSAAHVPGVSLSDFANRVGDSKRMALLQTGGDASTEAAVEAALRFLAADQRPNGSWNPATSGAGRETLTLGTDRKGAGRRATTGITGLALLSMLGAGNTHQQGPLADNVRRGLTYLILHQKPNGSLAGEADVYESNYCHGMAALAICEAAAMSGDAAAIDSATAAVRYTMSMQHPVTGGWRYVRGDPGDLSQLGWQAMVLDSGRTAGVPTSQQSFLLTARFVRSVRGGQQGGLASYRPGDGPSRTMTAEALATRLLLGEQVPQNELAEAEAYLLRQLPGIGRDNYYGWYYTSLALHQLQDDAWQTWNAAMKKHLLARQSSGGSWSTDSEWGGYGGRIYTTAMAALCLEVYYRHLRRGTAVAAAEQGRH